MEIHKLKFNSFVDDDGKQGLEHTDMLGRVVRSYYDKVDDALLKNMPDHFLVDLYTKTRKELIRRGL